MAASNRESSEIMYVPSSLWDLEGAVFLTQSVHSVYNYLEINCGTFSAPQGPNMLQIR